MNEKKNRKTNAYTRERGDQEQEEEVRWIILELLLLLFLMFFFLYNDRHFSSVL